MQLETTVVRAAQEASQKLDAAIKKTWSILDAASEKKSPSEYLSKQAISAIQGQ